MGKENMQVTNKYRKTCSKSYIARELQITTAVRNQDTPISKENLGGCKATGAPFVVGGDAKRCSHFGSWFGGFSSN